MSLPNNYEQLVVPPEVLMLLKLIMEHESQTLEKLINRVVTRHWHARGVNGQGPEELSLTQRTTETLQTQEELQHVMAGFFLVLEQAIHNAQQESDQSRQLS